tara:strand:+ start:224 stop:370 length:147 start_codon:yes stop_codon:yes gene_type:complete
MYKKENIEKENLKMKIPRPRLIVPIVHNIYNDKYLKNNKSINNINEFK